MKSEENWIANYEALKAYIDEHHHLPPKNAPLGAKYLLNWCKYVRKTIKEGTCDEWKKEMFEGLMAERHLDEHTGGRRKKSPLSDEGEDCPSTGSGTGDLLLAHVAEDLVTVLFLVLAARDVNSEFLVVAGLDDGLIEVRMGGQEFEPAVEDVLVRVGLVVIPIGVRSLWDLNVGSFAQGVL